MDIHEQCWKSRCIVIILVVSAMEKLAIVGIIVAALWVWALLLACVLTIQRRLMQALRRRNGSTSTLGSESTAAEHASPSDGTSDRSESPTPLSEEQRIRTFENFVGSPLQRPWLSGLRAHRRAHDGAEYERLSLHPLEHTQPQQGGIAPQDSGIEESSRNAVEAHEEATIDQGEQSPPPPYAKEDPCPTPTIPLIHDGRTSALPANTADERAEESSTSPTTAIDFGRNEPERHGSA